MFITPRLYESLQSIQGTVTKYICIACRCIWSSMCMQHHGCSIIEYGQVPCAHLPQLPDHADHPLHPAPHHPHFLHPDCLYLHHPQLLCLCSSLAATDNHCCHYTQHHWSWTEFPGLFCRLPYSLLRLKSTKYDKIIIIVTQTTANLHKKVYFK